MLVYKGGGLDAVLKTQQKKKNTHFGELHAGWGFARCKTETRKLKLSACVTQPWIRATFLMYMLMKLLDLISRITVRHFTITYTREENKQDRKRDSNIICTCDARAHLIVKNDQGTFCRKCRKHDVPCEELYQDIALYVLLLLSLNVSNLWGHAVGGIPPLMRAIGVQWNRKFNPLPKKCLVGDAFPAFSTTVTRFWNGYSEDGSYFMHVGALATAPGCIFFNFVIPWSQLDIVVNFLESLQDILWSFSIIHVERKRFLSHGYWTWCAKWMDFACHGKASVCVCVSVCAHVCFPLWSPLLVIKDNIFFPATCVWPLTVPAVAQVQNVAASRLVCSQGQKKSSRTITFKGIHHLGVCGELLFSSGYPLTRRDHKSALMDDVPKFAVVHTVVKLSVGCIRTLIC